MNSEIAQLTILHEDDDLLVVDKPAGLVCHPTKGDVYSSLISRVRLYLGVESRPHLINRLDRETSGVTVVAKNDAAARELRILMESRKIEKEYLAYVHGHVREDHAVIDAPLGKDDCSKVAIKDCVRADGAASKTEYWVERRFVLSSSEWAPKPGHLDLGRSHADRMIHIQRPFTLLRVVPHTGRKHQIRIHLAHVGHPIVGDKIYGGDEDIYLALVENRLTEEQRAAMILEHHALHASKLTFSWRGERLSLSCDDLDRFRILIEGSAEVTSGRINA